MATGLLALTASGPACAEGDADRTVLEQPLPNLPGKVLSAVVVEYAPGGRSPPPRHNASVFPFVLSGSIRPRLEGGGTPLIPFPGDQLG